LAVVNGRQWPLDDYQALHYHGQQFSLGSRLRVEVTAMTWEAPDFVEVKMDAEINSYQDDFGQEPDDRF
jgi:hypothetical protein